MIMRKILLLSFLVAVSPSLAKDEISLIRDACLTNVICTWEGTFAVDEVSPLKTNGLYVCTFTNSACEGTCVEICSWHTNGFFRVFQSGKEVKGVSPVILQIGLTTNVCNHLMWMLWRHPGNGGNMQYAVYEYTNLTFKALASYEYSETDTGHLWLGVDENGELGQPTNINFAADIPLWTNRKTKYQTSIPVHGDSSKNEVPSAYINNDE